LMEMQEHKRIGVEHPHAMGIKDVMRILDTREDGLSSEEAQRRLEVFGYNEIEERKKVSPLMMFLNQFKDVLIIILLIATLVSLALGEILDATVIFAIVIACAVLGFVQEYRSEKALEALRELAAPRARVLRDSKIVEIPAREVVPGDIIVLETGDRVPADARLIEAVNLEVDEAVLTGESVPVPKTTSPLHDVNIPVAERKNMVFMGTFVTRGRGKAVVTTTGMNTEFGKIAAMLQEVEIEKTPLQRKMEEVGKWLGLICLIVCFVVAGLGMVRGVVFEQRPPFEVTVEMFIWGVSLAVAAVPEALPAVVTISLAVGVQRMAKRNAIVRKLYAVETLGCVTVICSDKTGTITKNEMTVKEIFVGGKTYKVTGTGFEITGEFLNEKNERIDPREDEDLILLLEIGALCNDAKMIRDKQGIKWVGDPTEIALLVSAAKASIDVEKLPEKFPRIGEVPFDSMRKRMSTVHRMPDGRTILYMKGAPEVVLNLCSHIRKNGRVEVLSEEDRRRILDTVERMAGSALRVLAMAYRELGPEVEKVDESVEEGLIFVGLQGMFDPPREEVIPALEKCKKAGIKVKMITGDHKLTAVAVAREIGLLEGSEEGKVLTGRDLDRMSDEELEEVIEDVVVFARVSPEHKLRIVNALKKRGHVVAMTGDGVNDAPAVKRADVGVAMGIKGTDVTKEVADMVLADDNFATIVAAVEEGRGAYENIKKYLMYLLACNVGEILLMFVAGLLWLPLPLVAIQILLINLLTDGLPAIALGVDPYDPDIMERPPRDPEESIFTPMVKIFIATGGIVLATWGILLFYWSLLSFNEIYARTMCFWYITMLEMFAAFTARSERHLLHEIGPFKNKYLVAAVASSIIFALIFIYMPIFQMLFKMTALSLYSLLLAIPFAATILVAFEAEKYLLRGKIFGMRGK